MTTQIYRVFLDNPPTNQFLFIIRLEEYARPKVGDSLTDPITQKEFRVMRDEIATTFANRITDQGDNRVTDQGANRIVVVGGDAKLNTHNYFVQLANNPQRISTWTRSDFADDQTLRQLFR